MNLRRGRSLLRASLPFALLLAWLPAFASAQDPARNFRTWTDDRQHRIQGELVAVDRDTVSIRTADKTLEVDRARLSRNDQAFVEQHPLAERSRAEEVSDLLERGREEIARDYRTAAAGSGPLFVILLGGGLGLALIGQLLWIVAAFRVGLGWGLAVLLLPVVGIVFAFVHWDRAARGVWSWGLGLTLVALAFLGASRGWLGEPPRADPAEPQRQGQRAESPAGRRWG